MLHAGTEVPQAHNPGRLEAHLGYLGSAPFSSGLQATQQTKLLSFRWGRPFHPPSLSLGTVITESGCW